MQWFREKHLSLSEVLNERSRRVWAATEARSLGRGGIAAVVAATGMSSATVCRGLRELEAAEAGEDALSTQRIRNKGGGRKRAHDSQPGLIEALELLVEQTLKKYPCSTSPLQSLRSSILCLQPRRSLRGKSAASLVCRGRRRTGFSPARRKRNGGPGGNAYRARVTL